jgi:hypothetical protein
VDLAKVLYATGGEAGERYEKMLQFCEKTAKSPELDAGMLSAFAAWLRVRLAQVGVGRSVESAIVLD